MYINFRRKLDILLGQLIWSRVTFLFNIWIARASIFIPLIGYAILFNDTVSAKLSFNNIANEDLQAPFFSLGGRLRLIYFGLIALAVANAVYYLRRPRVMHIAPTNFEYVQRALDHFILLDYKFIVYGDQFEPVTKEVADFKKMVERDQVLSTFEGNWSAFRLAEESTLRAVLRENWNAEQRTRESSLLICALFAALGYGLLLLPSLDLFVSVVKATFNPLFQGG